MNKNRFRTLVSEHAAMRSMLVVEELHRGEAIGWLSFAEAAGAPDSGCRGPGGLESLHEDALLPRVSQLL